jgi:hypothetical protein
MTDSNAYDTGPLVNQMFALISARVTLSFFLEQELAWGEEDQFGSAHAPTTWERLDHLNRAFPDVFDDLENPLVALAEGC